MTATFDEELELALIELQQQGRLVDKYGHEHSEAVFKNWTPRAIRALGIRRVDDGDGSSSPSQFPNPKRNKEK